MNTMFSIYDKRQCFWQWDLDQKIVVANNLCEQVHFAFENDKKSVPCKVYLENEKRVADVPNELLQHSGRMVVYAYVKNQDGGRTLHSEIFTVIAKPKPDDYVYTETEVWTAEKAVAEALEEAKASGDFKGDKGDKGDAGVVKFVVVAELPDTGEEGVMYLLPKASGDNNNFEEYIFTNGAWECIGSASVEVNLDDYVKNTDYATGDKAGVVKVGTGLSVSADNKLQIQYAEKSAIQNKLGYRNPLVPQFIDDIVKTGITTNQLPLTDEEKQAAKNWLGVTENGGGSVEIPETLPNPHKLTFTGAVNAEYDGSKEVEVNIPESGGGGAEKAITIFDTTTTDVVKRIFYDIPAEQQIYTNFLVLIYPVRTGAYEGTTQNITWRTYWSDGANASFTTNGNLNQPERTAISNHFRWYPELGVYYSKNSSDGGGKRGEPDAKLTRFAVDADFAEQWLAGTRVVIKAWRDNL